MAKLTKKQKKRAQNVRIVGMIFSLALVLSSILFDIFLIVVDILPFKYLVIFLGVTNLFVFLFARVMIKIKYRIWFKIFIMFLSFICILLCALGCVYINKTYHFMDKIKSRNMIIENYYVIVSKDSDIESIDDLDGLTIGTFDEKIEIYNKAVELLNEKVSIKLEKYDAVGLMVQELIDGNIDAIYLSTYHKDSISETMKEFNTGTKILETIEVKVKNNNETHSSKVNVSKETFTIYISGIDQYGDISNRSRSDVNMLATINPKNHEVLLTSIPRDYYVQLYDTEGYYKDKLTHAGLYGVDVSVNTLKEFIGIDIDYYVKVNFSTLIDVVDVIGGIDVYSDKSFVPLNYKHLYIKEGINHMDGEMALAFARERYAYIEGDRHRVQNQQDVITAIIKKVTSSTTILTKYTNLLDQLSESFETNLGMNSITSLIKYQLDKMPSWTIKSYSLDGTDAMEYTYSFGQQELYVMIPKEETVNKASEYINGMENGKTFAELGIN